MAYNPVRKTVIVGNYEYDGNKLTYLESLSGCSEYLSQAMVISGVNAWFIGGRNYIGRVDMSDYSMREVILSKDMGFVEYINYFFRVRGEYIEVRRHDGSTEKETYYYVTSDLDVTEEATERPEMIQELSFISFD